MVGCDARQPDTALQASSINAAHAGHRADEVKPPNNGAEVSALDVPLNSTGPELVPTSNTTIEVAIEDIDALVAAGKTVCGEVRFRKESRVSRRVEAVHASCGCLRARADKTEIAPGEELTITLESKGASTQLRTATASIALDSGQVLKCMLVVHAIKFTRAWLERADREADGMTMRVRIEALRDGEAPGLKPEVKRFNGTVRVDDWSQVLTSDGVASGVWFAEVHVTPVGSANGTNSIADLWLGNGRLGIVNCREGTLSRFLR